jgi:23S rRNA pseudouridine1911/1915/1917 synthase
MDERSLVFIVEEEGGRIDRYIADEVCDLSRTAVQRLIDEKEIVVNGLTVQKSYTVQAGDVISVHIPPPKPTSLQPEPIPIDIVYEDNDILVVNKEAGIVVHPGAGHRSGTLANAILSHCPEIQGVGGKRRPGIVHRLDMDTSGVMVVAKNDQAMRHLQRQFKNRTVRKVYVALVAGQIPQAEGLIEAPIARHPVHRKRMSVRTGGKPARTRWRFRGYYRDDRSGNYTLLDIHLLTGRTHQIRVHFSWFGYPLVGDDVYAPHLIAERAPRQFLHARKLTLEHPGSGKVMAFEAPLPADLCQVLEALEYVDRAPLG